MLQGDDQSQRHLDAPRRHRQETQGQDQGDHKGDHKSMWEEHVTFINLSETLNFTIFLPGGS